MERIKNLVLFPVKIESESHCGAILNLTISFEKGGTKVYLNKRLYL